MRGYLKTQGEIPPEAHPLIFNTVVVDGKPVLASDFQGAVMFYGITSTGGHDRNPMPFEPRYPMVGMHLNLFNQIVTGDFIYQPPRWVDWLIVMVLALAMGLIIPKLSPVKGGIMAISMAVIYIAASVVVFAKGHVWIGVVGPFGTMIFAYLAITVRNYIVGEKEKKFIKGAFSAYLAPEVVDIIANDPEGLKLGGVPEHITAFFSDIKGFSSISEALTPKELVDLLNEYLTEMCDIAFKYGATVDKFIGDAIVAFFGAPIKYDDHARRACLCAVDMQARLGELRAKWKSEGKHEIFCRIGLNTGMAVIGNMGGRQRFNYTMMGDTVNLAARLESGAKQFGIYSMITEVTYQAAKEVIEVRELDKIVVIGKKEPVTIYEILSAKDNLDPQKKQVVDLYAEGLAYYREQNWDAAVAKWNAAMAVDPDHPDATSGIFIKRIDTIRAGKVEIPADWNGVWEMTEK
jgi:adenylate cyclase